MKVQTNASDRARKARALVEARGFGVLATVSEKVPGNPFASVAPYALDEQGRPVFLFSALAVHTRNLTGDPKASLLVYESKAEEDPLNSARVNLMGSVELVPESEAGNARARYLARHPDSAEWADFGDFTLYRLAITDVYYVGGFGEMGWVTASDFESAA